MVSNDFFLSPLAYIAYVNGKYSIGHLLEPHKTVEIEDLDSFEPHNETLQDFVFFRMNELKQFKIRYFELLEKKYRASKSKIGYIETTSVCPYHCVMCPKHDNKLIRNNIHMGVHTFNMIINQLVNQDEVELHLFGDPFCDPEIYTRIQTANSKGILPSFSTNLISLGNIDFHKLAGIKIKYLTISFDAYDADTLAKIRGKTDIETWNHCLDVLEHLIQYSKESGAIQYFVFQCIRLNINKNEREKIKNLASLNENCFYYEKNLVSFPLSEYHEQNAMDEFTFTKDEKILLYNLIGAKTPFKCLKVWKKEEMALTTDGDVVPCCLSFNDTVHVGNVQSESIYDIQTGSKYQELRRKIWEGEKIGSICDACSQSNVQYFHSQIPMDQIQKLRKYCIGQW